MAFKIADRGDVWIKAVLGGTAGTGKSYSAVKLASLLAARSEGVIFDNVKEEDSRELYPPALARLVGVIESENRSGEYAGKPFHFQVEELIDFGPEQWSRAIEEARRIGIRALVLDSMSDEWRGRGGVLQLVENSPNSIGGWKKYKPEHWRLLEQIQEFPGHVLMTVRSKPGIEISEDPKSGRKTITKTLPAPIQEEEFPFRFPFYWEMAIDEATKTPVLTVTKSVASNLPIGSTHPRPGLRFASLLAEWCKSEEESPSCFRVFRGKLRAAESREGLQGIGKEIAARLKELTIREVSFLRELLQNRIAEFVAAPVAEVKQ